MSVVLAIVFTQLFLFNHFLLCCCCKRSSSKTEPKKVSPDTTQQDTKQEEETAKNVAVEKKSKEKLQTSGGVKWEFLNLKTQDEKQETDLMSINDDNPLLEKKVQDKLRKASDQKGGKPKDKSKKTRSARQKGTFLGRLGGTKDPGKNKSKENDQDKKQVPPPGTPSVATATAGVPEDSESGDSSHSGKGPSKEAVTPKAVASPAKAAASPVKVQQAELKEASLKKQKMKRNSAMGRQIPSNSHPQQKISFQKATNEKGQLRGVGTPEGGTGTDSHPIATQAINLAKEINSASNEKPSTPTNEAKKANNSAKRNGSLYL